MARSIIGARIREHRRALGITQTDLARRIGISPSYLNLIERNKRGIQGRLLRQVAGELGLKAEDLDGMAERRLFEQLREFAADPRLQALSVEADQAGELLGRFPGWARAIGLLARSERELAGLVRALSDRLTHDPFLGEAVHRMLTHTAALRSAAEILTDVPDLEPGQRARFEEILAAESRSLSEVGEALAGYFDTSHTARQSVAPLDEVEALFESRGNRFAEIEDALVAARLARGDGAAAADRAIDAILADAPELESDLAREIAAQRLRRYAADAIALPASGFGELATSLGYDIELLSVRSGEPIERICRRLTALEPQPGRPRIGYVATNAAGVIIDFMPIAGLAPARHGGACPLWISCRAGGSPGQTLRQRAVFPTGLGFVFVARARLVGQPGFGQAALHVTDLIAMDERDAGLTVYGAGRAGDLPREEVGTSCRICPREDCAHRVEPGFGGA